MAHTFNLKAQNTKHYFTIRIFDTKQEMYEYWLKYCKRWNKDPYACNEFYEKRLSEKEKKKLGFASIVIPFTLVNTVTNEIANKIGECLFYKDRLGAGLVSHELLHAALWYDRIAHNNKFAVYGDVIGEEEERLAHELTNFVRKFTNKCYKLKIY